MLNLIRSTAVVLVFASLSETSAQYVFNSCNSHPAFGDSLIGKFTENDTTGITPGSSGVNVTWDFTNIDSTFTWPVAHYYVDPLTTEGTYMFPGADVADLQNGVYSYWKNHADSTTFLGDYHDSVNFHNSWDPQKFVKCPMNFGSSFTDFFSRYNFSQCPYHHTYTTRMVTYDAYGTLKVLGATYSVARLKIVENTLDTAICIGPSIITNWVDTTYLWYDIASGQVVFSWHYFYDQTNNYKNILINQFFYSHLPAMVMGIKEEQVHVGLTVYPNPSSGVFQVSDIPSGSKGECTVFNSVGQPVLLQKIPGQKMTIDLSSQPDGIYFLRMRNGEISSRGTIVLSR